MVPLQGTCSRAWTWATLSWTSVHCVGLWANVQRVPLLVPGGHPEGVDHKLVLGGAGEHVGDPGLEGYGRWNGMFGHGPETNYVWEDTPERNKPRFIVSGLSSAQNLSLGWALVFVPFAVLACFDQSC